MSAARSSMASDFDAISSAAPLQPKPALSVTLRRCCHIAAAATCIVAVALVVVRVQAGDKDDQNRPVDLETSPKRGIGVYGDTPGSPALDMQLDTASDLVGPLGWTSVFMWPVIGGGGNPAMSQANMHEMLTAAYERNLRPVVRLGWYGSMRNRCDAGSNHTRYTNVAATLAAKVAAFPLPPPHLGPLYLHAGNELNACNEWKCTDPTSVTLSLEQRALEVSGFMADTMAAFQQLPAAMNGSLALAHASVSLYTTTACQCTTNWNVGDGRKGVKFIETMVNLSPGLYDSVQWLSSHSYPFSNSDYSEDPSSKAYRGLTNYVLERAAVGRSGESLPVLITETGWSRNGVNNQVSAEQQANWTRLAFDRIWGPDPSVIAVLPFLLGGRFWEQRGWNFVACPPLPNGSYIYSHCGSPLQRLPVFFAWQRNDTIPLPVYPTPQL